MARGSQGFCITDKKGFHIRFENGWTVSVQFCPGNYCQNYDRHIGDDEALCGKIGSSDAECAMWGPDGNMIELGDGDTVTNRSSPADVLALLNRAAAMPVL